MHRRDQSGFTLIELLIVTVILAIIMAITVSTLLAARDKARQGATIADLRNLSTAVEAYTVDHSLPPASGPFPGVAQHLTPYHNRIVPTRDHWGHLYGYERDASGAYTIVSFGKDGIAGDDLTPETRFEFERDIVVSNGRFPGLP